MCTYHDYNIRIYFFFRHTNGKFPKMFKFLFSIQRKFQKFWDSIQSFISKLKRITFRIENLIKNVILKCYSHLLSLRSINWHLSPLQWSLVTLATPTTYNSLKKNRAKHFTEIPSGWPRTRVTSYIKRSISWVQGKKRQRE